MEDNNLLIFVIGLIALFIFVNVIEGEWLQKYKWPALIISGAIIAILIFLINQ